LHTEKNRFQAFREAFSGTAGAIALSGLTVMAALLLLLAAEYGSFHNFAVPFSLAIFIMMISSLTLVPALLGLFGRVSFWPFIPRTIEMEEARAKKKGKTPKHHKENRFWHKIGEMSAKHPVRILIITLIILIGCGIFTTQVKYTYDTLSTFPEDMPSREGFTLISDHFGAGMLAPMEVVVNSKESMKSSLENVEGVASVTGPERSKGYQKYTLILKDNPY
ncbi:MMPL family transporter, partial [Listeria welshimeri]|nr:MMPL family transporter [Listeria welshimeri]